MPISSITSSGALVIPFAVQSTPTAGTVTDVQCEVSYDRGLTWHPAPAAAGRLVLKSPTRQGTVSLRAHVTDSLDDTLTQTIYDALSTGG
jgi:hypothetical protein